jgi:hypothetical protein
MKRVVKMAWSLIATMFLAGIFFLFLVAPARAPHGGKNSLGGRSIASMQEKDFDGKLLHYQLCFGVKLNAYQATLERRRVCKVILVHRLAKVFAKPGSYLRAPMEFYCEDTVFTRSTASADTLSVLLKPNQEFAAIDRAVEANLETENVGESTHNFAKSACEFLTDCKLAMNGTNLSFRKLGACFTTGNLTHRKILLDEVGSMIFKSKQSRTKILYADLLQQAQF